VFDLRLKDTNLACNCSDTLMWPRDCHLFWKPRYHGNVPVLTASCDVTCYVIASWMFCWKVVSCSDVCITVILLVPMSRPICVTSGPSAQRWVHSESRKELTSQAVVVSVLGNCWRGLQQCGRGQTLSALEEAPFWSPVRNASTSLP
jgi:hypothetical protein